MHVPLAQIKNAYAYCTHFLNEAGQPIKVITYTEKDLYCWAYRISMLEQNEMIPFKLLADGQALYWTGTTSRILAPLPHLGENYYLRCEVSRPASS